MIRKSSDVWEKIFCLDEKIFLIKKYYRWIIHFVILSYSFFQRSPLALHFYPKVYIMLRSNAWPNSYVSQTEICNIQNKIWSIMKLFCIQEHSNFMESQSRKNNFYMPLPHPLERFFGNNFQLFIDICICILACRVCPPYNIFLIAGMSRILVITNSCCPIFISER